MLQVLDWRGAANPSAWVEEAGRALAQGLLVGFPTETSYVVAAKADLSEATGRLTQCRDKASPPCCLALTDAAEAANWFREIGTLGRRLMRRAWPGPVELLSSACSASALAERLPEATRELLGSADDLRLRVPDHEAILAVLERLSCPLLLESGRQYASAEPLLQDLGTHLAVLIDDGACREPGRCTVVRLAGDSWRIENEGVMTRAELEVLASQMIIFVCTGNTCRSPMAEAIFKKMLMDRLGCSSAELPSRGVTVVSAGLAAQAGSSAAAEAVATVQEYGADLGQHRSQPLNAFLLANADRVLVMTRSHEDALRAELPELGSRLRLLSSVGDDIADPIGRSQPEYRECAQQIMRQLERLLPEIVQ